jgi:hypothetical protein
MSISDFEDQVLKYVWRALVIAGLLTAIGGLFRPGKSTVNSSDANARQRPANAANSAGSKTNPAAGNQAR